MRVAQPGYENNVNTIYKAILYESSTTWIWKQCKYITKQYNVKVAQPGYENNVNTLLSNIIWK